ncbi:hypothetical protein ZWY2020_042555, partial [Hordeum vulgare]
PQVPYAPRRRKSREKEKKGGGGKEGGLPPTKPSPTRFGGGESSPFGLGRPPWGSLSPKARPPPSHLYIRSSPGGQPNPGKPIGIWGDTPALSGLVGQPTSALCAKEKKIKRERKKRRSRSLPCSILLHVKDDERGLGALFDLDILYFCLMPLDSWDDKLVDTQCCSRYELTRGKNDFPVAASLSNPEKWICFLNCILQCVVHTVPLVSKLLKDRHLGPCPTIFRDFEQGQHQDAHEFLRCLLDKLDEVTVAPRSESEEPSSIVKEFFGGQLKSQLNCPKCNHCSDRLESFLDLNLEVNQMDTIMDSLSSYTKIEVVEDFICDGCKSRVNMEKHLKVEQAPEVLVIQLKRFQNLGSDISKIHDMVKYQLELDLNPFMSSPDDKPQYYDLYGVVEHWGNTAKGHYVCYIRSSETDWFLFDDDKIGKMTEDRVLEKKAYVLFYVKKGSSPWFSTLLEKKEMLLSDYFEELAGKGLDEDGAPLKAGSYSGSGSDSDNGSVKQDVTEHCFCGPAEKNEAGPSSAGLSQGVSNGSTLCSVPDENEVGCSLRGVPSGGTQKSTSLTLSSVENGNASGLSLLLEYKEKSSHGTREANHNGPSSEVLDTGSHGGSSQENGRNCNLLRSSSHKHEDCCPENLTLHKEEEEDGMIGSCDSPAGSPRGRGIDGTSRLGTVGSNSDRTTNGECNTKFV